MASFWAWWGERICRLQILLQLSCAGTYATCLGTASSCIFNISLPFRKDGLTTASRFWLKPHTSYCARIPTCCLRPKTSLRPREKSSNLKVSNTAPRLATTTSACDIGLLPCTETKSMTRIINHFVFAQKLRKICDLVRLSA